MGSSTITLQMFESVVNSEGYQADTSTEIHKVQFESVVNSEGYQALAQARPQQGRFESVVNSKEYIDVIVNDYGKGGIIRYNDRNRNS